MRTLLTAIAAATLIAGLSACSSTSTGTPVGPQPTGSTPTGVTPTGSTPTGVTPTGSTPTGGTNTDAPGEVDQYLLEVADVGSGFIAGSYEPATNGQPCTPDEPPLSKKVPPVAAGGRSFDNAKAGAQFAEQVFIFSDEATAKQALATGERGMDCKTGKVFYGDGTTGSVTITAVSGDIAAQLDDPVDGAAAWSLENKDVDSSLIVVRAGVKLIVLTFSADPSADTTALPDSLKLTNAAVSRAINGR